MSLAASLQAAHATHSITLYCSRRQFRNNDAMVTCFLYIKSKILIERVLLSFYFDLFSRILQVYRIRIGNSVVAVHANFENR